MARRAGSRTRGARCAVAASVRVGADAVAVCLLHAYANPAHERLVTARSPPGYPVSASHELLAEYREYERSSTTVVNAYVAPLMSTHLCAPRTAPGGGCCASCSRTAARSRRHRRRASRCARCSPARPAASSAPRRSARAPGFARIITFDMGGTSTDVSLVDGAPAQHDGSRRSATCRSACRPSTSTRSAPAAARSPTSTPAARCRSGRRAPAPIPGPACYGRARTPTVTDANLVLGRLVPERSSAAACGSTPAGRGASRRALARRLGLDVEATAEGIVRVVNADMERAIRRHLGRARPRSARLHAGAPSAAPAACTRAHSRPPSASRGSGPGASRRAVGAGPAAVRRHLRLRPHCSRPLTTSMPVAWTGARGARPERPRAPGRRWSCRTGHASRVRARRPLRRAVVRDQRPRRAPAIRRGRRLHRRAATTRPFVDAFHAAHERLYGYADAERPVEVVNVRVRGSGRPRTHPCPTHGHGDGGRRARRGR